MKSFADKTPVDHYTPFSSRQDEVKSTPIQPFADNRPATVQMRALQKMADNSPRNQRIAQLKQLARGYHAHQPAPIQKKENNTGLPDKLKTGIETLSGYSMDDVRVHYHSDKPAQLQAHAYAQGTEIHVATGQEKHLPHEAWHVVQQKQGRVKPTLQMRGKVNVNDDVGLEKEADVMGAKAKHITGKPVSSFKMIKDQSEEMARGTEPQLFSNCAIQRVKGIPKGTYVEVKDESNPYYGVVIATNGDNYTIRIGGTDIEKTVNQSVVDFHPIHKSLNKSSVGNFLYDKDGKIKNQMSPKDEREKLKIAKNPGQKDSLGKYVYHSTSYKNLPSILQNGLDPNKGGGPGGSCELCEEGQLKETSIENSKNKIAVAVDRLTMGTYINQRENYASAPEQENSAGNFSVLLRFKVQERHQAFLDKREKMSSTWSKDPDDTRAWHLTGITVLPSELEFLTTEGWYPILALGNITELLGQ